MTRRSHLNILDDLKISPEHTWWPEKLTWTYLMTRTHSSSVLCLALNLWSVVKVCSPAVNMWTSRCRTQDTCTLKGQLVSMYGLIIGTVIVKTQSVSEPVCYFIWATKRWQNTYQKQRSKYYICTYSLRMFILRTGQKFCALQITTFGRRVPF